MGSGLYDDTPEGQAMEAKYGSPKKMTPGDAAGSFVKGATFGLIDGLSPEKASALSPGVDWSGNLAGSRGQMQAAMDPVQAWALSGQGPSAAQAQLQAGKDQAVAAAASQAKSAYGLTPGQQATLATNAGTQATQQAANQAAQLRAMEQQQAMQNYLGMLAAQRQADIDVYKAYSDQYAQTNMANAQSANAFKGGLIGTAAGIIGLKSG